MLELYTAATFNGQRVSIMLEETGLDYTAHRVDLMKGEQRQPEFLKLNPSGRIPVLIDRDDGHSAISGGENRTFFAQISTGKSQSL